MVKDLLLAIGCVILATKHLGTLKTCVKCLDISKVQATYLAPDLFKQSYRILLITWRTNILSMVIQDLCTLFFYSTKEKKKHGICKIEQKQILQLFRDVNRFVNLFLFINYQIQGFFVISSQCFGVQTFCSYTHRDR